MTLINRNSVDCANFNALHTSASAACQRYDGTHREIVKPVEQPEVIQERPLADSAEESPYIHPASKARFSAQQKGIQSQQPYAQNGMFTLPTCSNCSNTLRLLFSAQSYDTSASLQGGPT